MLIIHDKRLPEEYRLELQVKLPEYDMIAFGGPDETLQEKVYESILCHPDIYFFQLDQKTLIHSPCLPDNLLSLLKNRGIRLISGKYPPYGVYPYTARYNAVRVGNLVLGNLQYLDPIIIDIVTDRGLKLVNVNQGYTRCSVFVVDEEAIITADEGIVEAVRYENIEVLQVSSGEILLPGEKCGFIGGVGGMIYDNKALFFGDLKKYTEGPKIERFMVERGVKWTTVEGKNMYDAGGIMAIDVERIKA